MRSVVIHPVPAETVMSGRAGRTRRGRNRPVMVGMAGIASPGRMRRIIGRCGRAANGRRASLGWNKMHSVRPFVTMGQAIGGDRHGAAGRRSRASIGASCSFDRSVGCQDAPLKDVNSASLAPVPKLGQ